MAGRREHRGASCGIGAGEVIPGSQATILGAVTSGPFSFAASLPGAILYL